MKKTLLVILPLLIILFTACHHEDENKQIEVDGAINNAPVGDVAENDDLSQVNLYYYNESADMSEDGNVQCASDAVLSVSRQVSVSENPIQDTINLLIKGELTEEEISDDFSTEFPLNGFELVSVNLLDGSLSLEFSDPNNLSSGGSCRVNILRAQIEKTALQFEGVASVRFLPNSILQP